MDGYYVFSSSPCHREEPKFIVSANSDADAPEVMSSDSTLQVPKWEPTQSPPISSEVVPNRERSCMKRTTICGLPSTVFVLLVILAIAIVAAAVGGGLGGSIAVKNARSYVTIQTVKI